MSRVSGLGIFGPSASFKAAQKIRDEYNAMADNLRDTVDAMPLFLQQLVRLYLPRTRSVIARGALEADKQEIIAKLAEWEALVVEHMAAERAAVAQVVAEQQAESLRAEALIVQQAETAARIAAAEAQALVADAQIASQAAAQAAAQQAIELGIPLPAVVETYTPPVKAGLFDNPLVIVAAVGALIFLLKK